MTMMNIYAGDNHACCVIVEVAMMIDTDGDDDDNDNHGDDNTDSIKTTS